MDTYSWQQDHKIRGLNVVVDIPIGEYWETAKQIINKNELQRKKVSTRGKTYTLLRRDLLAGCIMPPIILAVTEAGCEPYQQVINSTLNGELPENTKELKSIILDAFANNELIILDGLQRTYTIRECISDAESTGTLDSFLAQTIRLEIYVGLSKAGILYRMMTLNTGQTPMSFRHQIEILYDDYLDNENLPQGIQVLHEKDERRARGPQKYRFSDVVDMFYAYTTGRPQSMDRQTLVSQLAETSFLEDFEVDRSEDLQGLLVTYDTFVRKLEQITDSWAFRDDPDEPISRPFGKDVCLVFERVQPMTAFGAEIRRLIKSGQANSFEDVEHLIALMKPVGDIQQGFDGLIKILDEIASTASKIGTAQRDYFRFSFRALFHEHSDCFLDATNCWLAGQETFNSFYGDLDRNDE